VADRYDTMTKAELEKDAAGRTPAVDLSGAANNGERAQLLRDADTAATEAAAAPEPAVAQPIMPDESVPTRTSEDQVEEGAAQAAAEAAPYPDDASQANAQAAAAGEVQAEQSIDPGKAEQVGGQADPPDNQ
jgi:hypothetical protein